MSDDNESAGVDHDSDLTTHSPFSPYLHTNYAPNPQEIRQLHSMLVSPRERLSSLSLQIQAAQAALDRLQAQHTELATALAKHEALLSPIRRLPQEILREIFIQCLPSSHLPVNSFASVPLLLTVVCKAWREIALSTPKLWAAIHLPAPYATKASTTSRPIADRHIASVRWWLSHSGETTPLKFSIYWPTRIQQSSGMENVRRRWTNACIFAFSTRLTELELDVPDNYLQDLGSYDLNHFAALRRVLLHLPVKHGAEPRGAGIADLNLWKAEKLESISWMYVDDDILSLPLANWSGVREIEVMGDGMTPLAYLSPEDALALCGVIKDSIERLTLQLTWYMGARQPEKFPHPGSSQDNEGDEQQIQDQVQEPPQPHSATDESSTEPPEPTIITMVRLHTLNLFDTRWDPERRGFLTPYLQLPSLESLTYRTPYSTYFPQSDSLLDALFTEPVNLPPAECPLLQCLQAQLAPVVIQQFTVHSESMTQPLLIECLRCMPRLSWLEVYDSEPVQNAVFAEEGEVAPSDALLKVLGAGVNGDDRDILCPLLETVKFSRTLFTEGMVDEFVRVRRDMTPPRLLRVEVGLTTAQPEYWTKEGESVDVPVATQEHLPDHAASAAPPGALTDAQPTAPPHPDAVSMDPPSPSPQSSNAKQTIHTSLEEHLIQTYGINAKIFYASYSAKRRGHHTQGEQAQVQPIVPRPPRFVADEGVRTRGGLVPFLEM